MGRLLNGSIMILFVVVVNFMVAFITTGAAEPSFSDCNQDGECDGISEANFFIEVLDVTYTGIDGAPLVLNALYVLVMGFLLTVGILLVTLAFIPTTSE